MASNNNEDVYGDLEQPNTSGGQSGPVFATADDDSYIDDELAALEKQVHGFHEDHTVRQMHEAATAQEGSRQGVQPAQQGGSAPTGGEGGTKASVFVGNMDPACLETDLRLFFADCGAISRVTILKDHVTKQPKGSAYVEFESEDSINAALLLNNQQCRGRPLKIAAKREAVPANMRGGPRGGGAGFFPRGGVRGGRGAAMMGNFNPQQAMMMGQLAMMMAQQGGFNPMMGFQQAPRGGGRGGGRGRGGPPRGRGGNGPF
jgi:polyadenylate-binding protein 2